MTTWECNCIGDPVADASGELLAAILSADLTQKTEWKSISTLLLRSQKRLMQIVCSKPWNRENVLWVNSYVETEEALSNQLTRVGIKPNRLFLAKPAAIRMKQAEVNARHSALFKLLGNRPEPWWLTLQLAESDVPGVTTITKEKDSFVPSSDKVTINTDPAKSAYSEFFKNLDTFCYLHISLPCRNALSKVVGPAGVYLLLQNQDAAKSMPACLKAHLQTFLHAIVTAHLWSLGEHLRRGVAEAAAPFPLHRDRLRTLSEAADNLLKLVDPISIDTAPFDAAQRHAFAMFNIPGKHDVKNWRENLPQAKTHLQALSTKLMTIIKQSRSDAQSSAKTLVRAINTVIQNALKTDTDDSVHNALRHAKALDHHSICLELLKPNEELRTIRPYGALQERYLREAVVQLYQLRDRIEIIAANSYYWISLKYQDEMDVGGLVKKARDFVDGMGVTGLSPNARELAPILRGLQGEWVGNEEAKDDWWRSLSANSNVKILVKTFLEE